MPDLVAGLRVRDGEPVRADQMAVALTAGVLVFDDGATQEFTEDGHTTYIDRGHVSHGDWRILGDGRFASFWPPGHLAAYTLQWTVEGGAVVGLTFTEAARRSVFAGRYR